MAVVKRSRGGVPFFDASDPGLSERRRQQAALNQARQDAASRFRAETARGRETRQSEQTFKTGQLERSVAANRAASGQAGANEIIAEAAKRGDKITPEFVRSVRASFGGGADTGRALRSTADTRQFLADANQKFERQQAIERQQKAGQMRTGIRRVPAAPIIMEGAEGAVSDILRQAGIDTLPALPQYDTRMEREVRNRILAANRGNTARRGLAAGQKEASGLEATAQQDIRDMRTDQQRLMSRLDSGYAVNQGILDRLTQQQAASGGGGLPGDRSVQAAIQGTIDLAAQRRAEAGSTADRRMSDLNLRLEEIGRIPTIGPGVAGAVLGAGVQQPTAEPMPVTERSQGRGQDQELFERLRAQQTGTPLGQPAATPSLGQYGGADAQRDAVIAGMNAPTPATAQPTSANFFQNADGTYGSRNLRFVTNPDGTVSAVPIEGPSLMSAATSPGTGLGSGPPAPVADQRALPPDRAAVAAPPAAAQAAPQPTEVGVSALIARIRSANPTMTLQQAGALAVRQGAPQAMVDPLLASIGQWEAGAATRQSPLQQAESEFRATRPAQGQAGGSWSMSADPLTQAKILAAQAAAKLQGQTGELQGLDINAAKRTAEIQAAAPAAGNITQLVENVRNIIAPRGKISSIISLGGPDEQAASQLASSIGSALAAMTPEQRRGVTGFFGQPDNPTVAFIRSSLAAFARTPGGIEFGPGQEQMRVALTQILSLLTNPAATGSAPAPSGAASGGAAGNPVRPSNTGRYLPSALR